MFPKSIAVLDTETTGFHPARGDKIIEIAVAKIFDGNTDACETFSCFVNPERSIPPAATRVNHIVDDMVKDAPLFSAVYPEVQSFLEGVDYLLIHNAKFDLAFLEAEAKNLGHTLTLPKVVCSVELSRELYPEVQYHNLDALLKRFQIQITHDELRHRALGDVLMTSKAISKMYEDNPIIFLGTLEGLASSQYCRL